MPTATTVPVKMAQRRDTAANWTSANPTLLAGEIGIESDTLKWKVGTGSTAWTSLGYIPAFSLSAYPLVNADIASAAAIAYSKLATLTSGNIVLGNASNVATSTAVTGDVTISNTGVTAIATGVIVNADINASAAIVDTKLATIATAGKVSNSATTATNANTPSAIVSRDASGNFTAGTITAALTGTASGNLVSGGALGTPSSGTLTSCTGLPISTGVSGLGTGAATFLATPSSANFAALLTDETGSGSNVFATSPTLVTPVIGAATGTSLSITGAAGLLTRAAATQDGVELIGRAGGATSLKATITPTTLTASRTFTLPDATGTLVTTGDTGTVTSTMLLDGTILNADINASAAIAGSKIVAATTSVVGAVQLSDSTSTTSSVLAATPTAVKAAYDLAAAALPKAGGTLTGNVILDNQVDARFREATANGTNYVGFQAPATIAADVLWTLPATDGTSNQVLKTDGAGTLSWTTPTSGGVSLGLVIALS